LNNKKSVVLLTAAIVLLLAACSGSKNGSKMSLLGRFYHNTTARYNGYYYGKLKLNHLKENMTSSLEDDYTRLLPLFKDEEASGGSKSDFDSIIIRLTVVTKLHPKSKWVDDCYYLIGQSYYYKEDYEDALATFQYVSAAFKDDSKKKKSTTGKKIKVDDVTIPWMKTREGLLSFLHQKPVRYQSLLWLLKTYIEIKNYDDAASIMKLLDTDKNFPFDLRDEYALINAQLYIKQERWKEAILPMKEAIALTKSKKDRQRYTYILAQLYQLTNNSDKAIEYFKKVIALKPAYKMEFYSYINIAKSFNGSGKTSADDVLALLEKLSKDGKFDEFLDQIYYTMAEVYLKQNLNPAAVKYLVKSIDASTTNVSQKALSYLKLAEIDFDARQYISADKFYDSTALFVSKSMDKYDEVFHRKEILDKLVANLNVVAHEDSLQHLASMDKNELNKFLDAMIDKYEEQLKKDSAEANNDVQVIEGNKQEDKTLTTGSWYFYNPATKGAGYNDFKKKWGNRVNEDNWRRSNKANNDVDGTATNNQDANGNNTSSGKLTRDDLMKDIPFSPVEKGKSDLKIQNALYNAGTIYKEDLRDYDFAKKTFEDLLKRYQKFPNEPNTYYALYLLYMNDGIQVQMDNYKQLILKNYPNTDFAKLLDDPDYLVKKEAGEKQAENYYQVTFSLYQQKNYAAVLQKTYNVDSLFKPNPLSAKFALLRSFAVAQTQPADTFKNSLKNIVKKYVTGEEVDKAKQLLLGLDKPKDSGKNSKKDSTQTDNSKSIYALHKTNPHYFIILFTGNDPEIKNMDDSLQNFITKNYSLSNYKVSSIMVGQQQAIQVKQMKNMDDAMKFYSDASSQSFYDDISESDYFIFVIDDKNWQLFYSSKNITDYMDFFDKNYNL